MSPEAPQQTDSKLEAHPDSKSLGNLSFIRVEMVKAMEGISNLVERGSSTTLLVLGSFVLIFLLFSKLQPFSTLFDDLSSAEFIWSLLVALILLLAGSGIRVYQFRVEQEFGRLVRESGIELVSKGMDAGVSLSKGPPERGKPI